MPLYNIRYNRNYLTSIGIKLLTYFFKFFFFRKVWRDVLDYAAKIPIVNSISLG